MIQEFLKFTHLPQRRALGLSAQCVYHQLCSEFWERAVRHSIFQIFFKCYFGILLQPSTLDTERHCIAARLPGTALKTLSRRSQDARQSGVQALFFFSLSLSSSGRIRHRAGYRVCGAP